MYETIRHDEMYVARTFLYSTPFGYARADASAWEVIDALERAHGTCEGYYVVHPGDGRALVVYVTRTARNRFRSEGEALTAAEVGLFSQSRIMCDHTVIA